MYYLPDSSSANLRSIPNRERILVESGLRETRAGQVQPKKRAGHIKQIQLLFTQGMSAVTQAQAKNKPVKFTPFSSLPLAGTSVFQITATDADDPTYGNSARIVYSILQGQPYFTVDPKTGEQNQSMLS